MLAIHSKTLKKKKKAGEGRASSQTLPSKQIIFGCRWPICILWSKGDVHFVYSSVCSLSSLQQIRQVEGRMPRLILVLPELPLHCTLMVYSLILIDGLYKKKACEICICVKLAEETGNPIASHRL